MERSHMIWSAKDMGALFRARRKELKLTQSDAAEYCGYSTRLISEIERGRDTVGYGKILRYAAVLGIDLQAQVRG